MSDADKITPEAGQLLVVVGPTASGKSALALDLAERLGGEIIGADSVQIYRAFELGSGRPSASDMARVRHHLVGVVDPLEHFDAARFVTLADAAIADVRSRERTPIVCGGTFLWIKALLFGLAEMPPGDPAVRARHEAEAASHGRARLHERLATVDRAAAERLAPNDLVRVSRALEVYELTGRTLSSWHADHAFERPRYPARLLGVARERSDLDARIAARTLAWLDAGWVAEVRHLLAEGYGEARAMESVGFRQIREHLRGELPEGELATAIIRATRRFVRRQRTWLRDQPVEWLNLD